MSEPATTPNRSLKELLRDVWTPEDHPVGTKVWSFIRYSCNDEVWVFPLQGEITEYSGSSLVQPAVARFEWTPYTTQLVEAAGQDTMLDSRKGFTLNGSRFHETAEAAIKHAWDQHWSLYEAFPERASSFWYPAVLEPEPDRRAEFDKATAAYLEAAHALAKLEQQLHTVAKDWIGSGEGDLPHLGRTFGDLSARTGFSWSAGEYQRLYLETEHAKYA